LRLRDLGELVLRSTWTANTHTYPVRYCGWIDDYPVFLPQVPLALTDEVLEAVLDSLDGRECRVSLSGQPLGGDKPVTVRVLYGDDLLITADSDLHVVDVGASDWVLVPMVPMHPDEFSLLDEVLS
jgi:hypothetical protein